MADGGLLIPDALIERVTRDYERELRAMVAGLAPTSGNPFAGLRATLRSAIQPEEPFKFGDVLVNREGDHVIYIAKSRVLELDTDNEISSIEGQLISDWTVVET